MINHGRGATVTLVAAGLLVTTVPAAAQIEEIIVSARKRDETALATPVVMTTLSSDIISRAAIRDLAGISQQVPSMIIGEGQTMVGGTMALRGVSTGTANGSSDQAVAINIDGVQVARGTLLRLGYHDLQQVEVLKGPQALFFGKNSPGGVISLKSKDPTDEFEVSGRVGYEFVADEKFGEVIVSGPITDELGARAVFYVSDMQGPFKNIAVGQPGVFARHDRLPNTREYFGRITLKYEPSERVNFRLKGAHFDVDSEAGVEAYTQRWYCGTGSAIGAGTIPGLDDCKLDRNIATGDPGPAYGGLHKTFPADGQNYMNRSATLGSLEANFAVSDQLNVASITGYIDHDQKLFSNFLGAPIALLVIGDEIKYSQFSQELRLSTDLSGPLNFMVGGFYENSDYNETGAAALFGPAVLGTPPDIFIDGESISGFGQANFMITEQLELSGGLRWTRETKEIEVLKSGVAQPVSPKQTYKNTSPEITLNWRPSDELTLFGAYKEGFKSGGFNSGISALSTNTITGSIPFRPEKAKGFEVGIKGLALDRTVRFEAAAYRYKYSDLQLTTFDPTTGFTASVTNAAASRIQGVELSGTWAPKEIEGLQLNTAVNYNKARYLELLATCYTGQTAQQGCNVNVGPVTLQDMKGKRLVASPDWSMNFGASFDRPFGNNGMRYTVSGDTSYKSKYPTFLQDAPRGEQKGFWMFNANATVYSEDNGWSISLIGRNLTQKFYVTSGYQDSFSFLLPPGTEPNVLGSVNRPREFILQFTIRPSELFRR